MKRSEFRAWFIEQFGRAPDAQRLTRLRVEFTQQRIRLGRIEARLRADEALQRNWDAALYGWNARKK